ncbi:MAG: phosphotransferase [Anaerolineaceae bacterium]|nr:phosphotransferase [Anaerolineaceae bacterium]
MAAGKSTIAQAAAERLPKSVHLRGDLFRRMMINGQVAIQPPLSDEALGQLRLRYQLAAQAADTYCAAGFTVVYQDVIIGEILNEVVALHQRWPLYVVVLCPSPAAALERDANRHKQTYSGWTPEGLDASLRDETPKIGLWLDTTSLTVDETVDAIFNQLETAYISH